MTSALSAEIKRLPVYPLLSDEEAFVMIRASGRTTAMENHADTLRTITIVLIRLKAALFGGR